MKEGSRVGWKNNFMFMVWYATLCYVIISGHGSVFEQDGCVCPRWKKITTEKRIHMGRRRKVFYGKILPPQGLEPRYPAWKASMITTYIMAETLACVVALMQLTFTDGRFSSDKKWTFPPRGLEPRYPAWEASMITTYIMAESTMHQPRIELGAKRWQRFILPLNHWCVSHELTL